MKLKYVILGGINCFSFHNKQNNNGGKTIYGMIFTLIYYLGLDLLAALINVWLLKDILDVFLYLALKFV